MECRDKSEREQIPKFNSKEKKEKETDKKKQLSFFFFLFSHGWKKGKVEQATKINRKSLQKKRGKI